jgi:hypothetical protein
MKLDAPFRFTSQLIKGFFAMVRSLLIFSALAGVAAPAAAASYSAKLAIPTTERFIARDIVWTCGTDACQGATEESRPVVLCQGLARHAGAVDTFLVDGRAFSAAEIAQCNSSARPAPNRALAAQ